MSWSYEQLTGNISHDGEAIATGYAGIGAGLNNPNEQDQPFVGPLPRGTYTIGAPIANGGHLGPFVLPLTPWATNQMFGRAGFFIHGDRIAGPPHTASNGCIILDRLTRNLIAETGDTVLIVI
jgi:hypothetical protein